MLLLSGTWDYVLMLATAAIAGAIGGIGFELMQTRLREHTGALETPHRLRESHYFDMGFLASLFLGAITAVAVLYFFPPDITITVNANGPSTTQSQYDIVKLIAFSLIVGSAGPSFLSSLQTRVSAALNEQKIQTVNDVANQEVDRIGQATQTDLEETHSTVRSQVEDVINKLPEIVAAQVGQASVVSSTNGTSSHAGVAATDQMTASTDVSKHLAATIDKLHDICNNAETRLKDNLQKRVDAAKKTLNAASEQ